MIILPDRNVPRARFLLPVLDREWREPSQSIPRDEFGNLTRRTRFRVRAKTHDGVVLWVGWFNDRADFDAFLWTIARGTLPQERALWSLPLPMWPGLPPGLIYDFATVVSLTGPTGSNQTYTSPTDWVNGNNSIQTLGAGGSGGCAETGSDLIRIAAGGGGGAWNKIVNFAFATPGTTTATFEIGTGGAIANGSSASGVTGGDTWFGGATLGASAVGSKGGGGGGAGGNGTSEGAGGVGASGVGTSSFNGGRGGAPGTAGANTQRATGGGGAAGQDGAGANGVDSVADDTATNGGAGNAGSNGGGSAGAGATSGGSSGSGGNGTNLGSNGSGGGGGALKTSTAASTAGSGGNCGAGGGGIVRTVTGGTGGSGVGRQGLVVLIFAPITAGFNMPMLGM